MIAKTAIAVSNAITVWIIFWRIVKYICDGQSASRVFAMPGFEYSNYRAWITYKDDSTGLER